MNILVLAAGEAAPVGDGYPLCLAEFDGVPLIQKIIEACVKLAPEQLIVTLRSDEVRRFHLDNITTLLAPRAEIIEVQDRTQGAACTALLATEKIDNDRELLIVNGNDLVDADLTQVLTDFRRRKLDAGTIVFPSVHPRYSYVKVDSDGHVIQAAEKNPISRHATVGVFWFKKGRDFVEASKNMIRKDAAVNGVFYISPALNELVLRQHKIGIHPIEANQYHPLKSERQIEFYEASLERSAP